MSASSFLSLSDDELAGYDIGAIEIADCIENALKKSASGRVWTAPKVALQPGDGRYMMATLAASDDPGVMVVKSVLLNPENPARGLETINGAIMVFDSATGLLRCVMGANWVTAVRTAGLSAVAARRLADPDASVIAFVGCGAQARSHLKAFSEIFPLAELRALGRGQKNIDQLTELGASLGLSSRVCSTAREVLDGADIVVTSITATFEGEPFLDAGWLKPGAFATVTDIGKPWITDSLSAFDTLVIDDHAQEKASPVPMVSPDLVTADLTGLCSGDVTASFDPRLRSAFIFRGMAIGDFAIAALAYDRARERARKN